ncbi:MAG: hypothetical protein AB7P07_08935 [Hyphomonadaceae bacterium]
MSRLPLPRRFLYAPSGVLVALAVLASAALGVASAQTIAATPQGNEGPGAVLRLNSTSNAAACTRFSENGSYSDDAVQACSRALQRENLNPVNLVATHINRGNMYLRRQEGEAALADFDAVALLAPRNAEARLNRGVALIMLERFGPAVAAITEALSLGVTDPHKAYYNRGAAREALDDIRGAYEDYSTALEIEPDWGPANAELQRIARVRQEWLASLIQNDESETQ